MNALQLNTGKLLLEFSGENGALIKMTALETGWKIQKRPELGLSWRLLVPLHDELRNNPVHGEKQKLASVEEIENGLRFTWKGVTSERGGDMDITVSLTVKAEDGQAVWYTEVENNSPYIIEAVYAPYLGDFYRPDDATWMKAYAPDYASSIERNIYPTFDTGNGPWGLDYPAVYVGSGPNMPFVEFQSDTQGLFMGVKGTDKEVVSWHWEMRPGWKSNMGMTVIKKDEIAGKPVHVLAAAVHMPYIMPGEKRALTPIMIEPYQGTWHKGVDIYRKWRDSWSNPAKAPAWATEPHCWQQIQMNSPEDELRLRFTDLPKVAAECAKHGVTAIQLVGWNYGGQDQNNPCHDPDPRLGTFEELKQAIADCQKLGVKIILFAKFTWADIATERFRTELNRMAIRDPYGDYYQHPGYSYYTPTQIMSINTKRFAVMCFGSDEYMEVCKKEFAKLIELNCDGFLYDEGQHHNTCKVCFDTSHGHRYGWPVYSRDCDFVKILKTVPGLREDFLFSGEAVYDWEQEDYGLVYHRTEQKRYLPMPRYMRPHQTFMTFIPGFDDRNMVNQSLMHRYILSYEPYNFKGHLEDFPDTLEYGKKMCALREEYRRFFWDGEFRDTCGAKVIDAEGKPYPTYSHFIAENGDSAMVICNYEEEELRVRAETDAGKLTSYRLVDDETILPADGEIVIPACSAAIVF